MHHFDLQKNGLVLSGGGIRGIAHLGVLKALSDKSVPVHAISGTSAGAIAGAFFAQGIDPFEILQIFLKTQLFKVLRLAFGRPALLNLEYAASFFKEHLPEDSFEDLKIPLYVAATNFNTGRVDYFNRGNLIGKVLASCCIPGVFNPILIGDDYYVDGGIVNNFPLEPLLHQGYFIIGSSCNHLPPLQQIRNMKHVVERAATLAINHDMEEKCRQIDLLIEPYGIGERGIFEVSLAEEIYWLAYEAALKKLDGGD